MAVSPDGKVGLGGRKRTFITGDETQARVHRMRAMSDAVLTGVGTVLADNPQLTSRLPGLFEKSPIRVVLDARLQTPLSLAVVSTVRETPTWIFCSTKASPVAEEILTLKGVKVFRVEEQNGKLDLDRVLQTLAGEGITRLMVEAGPRVAASFVGAGLVDEVALLRGPKEIGEGGLEALDGMALDALTDGMTLRGTEQLGPDSLELYERV
jgi:diaminohydroxyphosphoribosylaminopyrimidine deaminase/5-amino-6-(5-phosphoribosylamino)uracil reductase